MSGLVREVRALLLPSGRAKIFSAEATFGSIDARKIVSSDDGPRCSAGLTQTYERLWNVRRNSRARVLATYTVVVTRVVAAARRALVTRCMRMI